MAEPNFDYNNSMTQSNVADQIKLNYVKDYPKYRDYIIHNVVNLVGVSSDRKPIPCGTGSTFYEIDTGDLYILISFINDSDEYEQEWVPTPIPEDTNS